VAPDRGFVVAVLVEAPVQGMHVGVLKAARGQGRFSADGIPLVAA